MFHPYFLFVAVPAHMEHNHERAQCDERGMNQTLTNFEGRASSNLTGAPMTGDERTRGGEGWFDKVSCKHDDLIEAALREFSA